MKKIFAFSAALLALASCGLKEEFQPVFTGKYDNPSPASFYVDSDFNKIITIAELASTYTLGKPDSTMQAGVVIKGRVSTTDRPGNFYKSFYIQDETGGIEIKVGRNALYNEYHLGQTVYVNCEDLALGMYGYKSGNYGGIGMIQIGYADYSHKYETSYIEDPLLIDNRIFKGDPSDTTRVTPYIITESQLPNAKSDTQATNKYVGSLVTLKGLKYGKEVFVLLYLDSQKDKSSYTNRVFLSSSNSSDATCGITTWAMSKSLMTEYLKSGKWDECKVGSGSTYATDKAGNTLTLGSPSIKRMYYVNADSTSVISSLREKDYHFTKMTQEKLEQLIAEDDEIISDTELDLYYKNTYPGCEKAAYSVSQYLKMGNTEIQLRTSGFCKFCDYEIPMDVLDGTATMDITGILTLYQGSYQLVVNSLDDIVVNAQ